MENTKELGFFDAPEPDKEQTANLNYLQIDWFHGLDRIYALQTNPRRYYMRTTTGQIIELGTTADLMNQRTLRTKILDQTNTLPEKIHQEYWEPLVKKIVSAAIPVEAPEAGERDFLMSVLESYLDKNRPATPGDRDYETKLKENLPIFYRGMVCVSLTGLSEWYASRGWRTTPESLAIMLRKFGFIHYRVKMNSNLVGKIHRRYWGVPMEFVPEAIAAVLIKELSDVLNAKKQAN